MKPPRGARREIAGTLALVALACLLAWQALAALPASVPVSQRGRHFEPNTLVIRQGDVVEILNDDGELLHHAYVDAPGFQFDSGEQEPGSKTPIHFTVAGNFVVLCRIHPKMRLSVEVK